MITGLTYRDHRLTRLVRDNAFADWSVKRIIAPSTTWSAPTVYGPEITGLSWNEAIDMADALCRLGIVKGGRAGSGAGGSSIFGLGGYVFGGDRERGYRVASQIAAGRVCFNGAPTNSLTPMGGYKQSGIGRSMGVFGLEEYLEVKSVYGFAAEAEELPEHV